MARSKRSSAATELLLLKDVVKYKKAFFNSANTRYDDCLNGNLRLYPSNDEMRQKLKEDYGQMVKSGMFRDKPPSFENIMEKCGNWNPELIWGLGLERIMSRFLSMKNKDLSS